MTMKMATWHYHWYQYWLTNGRGNSPTYRESLCHYFWVIVFWAPMTWIDQHTRINWDKVALGGTIGLLATMCLILLGTFIYQYPMQMSLAGISLAGAIFIGVLTIGFFRWRQGKNFGIASTASLTWSYAVAKKRRICPYLEFE